MTERSQKYYEAAQDLTELKVNLARLLNNSLQAKREQDKKIKLADKNEEEVPEEEFNRGNMITPDMFDIVDRCRKDKISFHIRLPNFVIERLKLNLITYNLKLQGDLLAPESEE